MSSKNYKNKWIPEESLKILNSEQGRILYVGGGAAPFCRAAHVADIQPHDAERLAANAWGHSTDGDKCNVQSEKKGEKKGAVCDATISDAEPSDSSPSLNLAPSTLHRTPRWDEGAYTQIDLCQEKLPFEDKSFDLGLCSHVLEDLRDPIRVVHEMFRVCRRVMVIGPSRLLEQTKGIEHPRYAGFYHHMWMMYEQAGDIVFRRKTPTVNLRGCHLSCPPFRTLTREAGSFMYLSEAGHAKEAMYWSETEDAQELRAFVKASKGRDNLLEFDPNWRRPSFVIWKLRQMIFGVE